MARAEDEFGRSNAATTSGCGVGRGLLQLDGLAAVIPATVRADVVRQLLLVAVVALLELRHAQRQVGATLTLTGVRDASLGNTHGRWSPSMSSGWRPDVGRAEMPHDGQGRWRSVADASLRRERWRPDPRRFELLSCARRASSARLIRA